MKKFLAILLVCVMALSLMPIGAFAAAKTDFEAFDLKYSQHGSSNGNFRFIMNYSDVPLILTQDNLVNLKIKGELVTDTETIPFTSYIKEVDLRVDNFIMVVPGVGDVSQKNYGDTSSKFPAHKFKVKVYPEVITEEEIAELKAIPASDKVQETAKPQMPEIKILMEDKENHVYYFMDETHFAGDMGEWVVTDGYMYGAQVKNATANAKLVLPNKGTYTVWVRVRDYATSMPGKRSMSVAIDGDTIGIVGKHGKEGFYWEKAGELILSQGDHKLSAINSSGYFARFDMVCVTDDNTFVPSDDPGANADVLVNNLYDASKVTVTADPDRPDVEIAVKFNDEYMLFDVDPVMLNDRVLVPLRAIFEKLGCVVKWDDATRTVTAEKSGKKVIVNVGSSSALVGDNATYLDQPPVMLNDRVLVPLRFVSEAFGCEVSWGESTQTVSIKAEETPYLIYLNNESVVDLGDWIYEGSSVLRGSNLSTKGDETTPVKNAKMNFTTPSSGTYNIWVSAKDYSTNQPGTRYFHVAVDGVQQNEKLGDHGNEGFAWELVGQVDLEEGEHTLEFVDTSRFYARFSGALLVDDLDFVPTNSEIEKFAAVYKSTSAVTEPSIYPGYAMEDIEAVKQDSIENDSTKIVFYQGPSSLGNVVQHEIYMKDNSGNWVLVKGRKEESGFLLKSVQKSSFASGYAIGEGVTITAEKDGKIVEGNEMNFYNMGATDWLIPDDFIKISDKEMKVYFPANEKVSITATYLFDDLADDPKVTLRATFNKPGDYSFAMYSGNGVTPEQYDTVTAPIYYVKHGVAPEPYMITQPGMYTPMNTLYFKADNNVKTPGMELVSGLAVDPTCVDQRFALAKTSSYATMFYDTAGKVRPTLIAPVLGTDRCTFNAGDDYTFSYRIINRSENWYDTFKHVAQDLFNCTDLRTNYYGSINDSIYNITDLLMDDFYGGWDDQQMGWYNIEYSKWISQANFMELLQRYRFTENEDILLERVVPTLAFALSRGSSHYVYGTGTNNGYAPEMAPLKGHTRSLGTSTWAGLYEMSQGRMPSLLDIALNGSKAGMITHLGATYKYTQSETDKEALIKLADEYLAKNPLTNRESMSAPSGDFLYYEFYTPVVNLVAAYEMTGEQKYLDAAEEAGRYLMTSVWTTGYQNDYAENTMHIDPKEQVERVRHADGFAFWWHGDFRWRPGNEIGESYNAKELYDLGISYVPEEDVPGWLAAPTAHGAEMKNTPMHGNIISMNSWLGTMVRLSKYTGDEFFETQARNAIIGRYQNYPGYYIDRYLPHAYHADYPYKGPDLSSIYWHHIPPYLAQVEDFLINEIWSRSVGNIEFPFAYQSGYVYFYSYQFGVDSGKFYDHDDMWIWLDRGIIEPDSINIDYLTAKKDGVLGIALMNEDKDALTTTVSLGEKIPNAESINTTATLYDATGNKSTVDVVNGKFTVTIPRRGIMSVVIEGIDVKAPAYAQEYTPSTEVGQTVSAHVNGKGYVIQLVDDFYHAYVYIAENTENVKSARLTYTVNGETKVIEDSETTLEWLIKVDDPDAEFTYSIEVVNFDGSVEDYGGGTLKTLKNSKLEGTGVVSSGILNAPDAISKNSEVVLDKNDLSFEPFDMKYITHGSLGGDNFRFVVSKSLFPFEVTADSLHHLLVKGELTDILGRNIPFESYISACEIRPDGNVVLTVPGTKNVGATQYTDSSGGHKFKLKIYPQE